MVLCETETQCESDVCIRSVRDFGNGLICAHTCVRVCVCRCVHVRACACINQLSTLFHCRTCLVDLLSCGNLFHSTRCLTLLLSSSVLKHTHTHSSSTADSTSSLGLTLHKRKEAEWKLVISWCFITRTEAVTMRVWVGQTVRGRINGGGEHPLNTHHHPHGHHDVTNPGLWRKCRSRPGKPRHKILNLIGTNFEKMLQRQYTSRLISGARPHCHHFLLPLECSQM